MVLSAAVNHPSDAELHAVGAESAAVNNPSDAACGSQMHDLQRWSRPRFTAFTAPPITAVHTYDHSRSQSRRCSQAVNDRWRKCECTRAEVIPSKLRRLNRAGDALGITLY